jgi:hypothetical protein
VTGLQNQIRAQFSAMATRLSAIENTTGQNRRNS